MGHQPALLRPTGSRFPFVGRRLEDLFFAFDTFGSDQDSNRRGVDSTERKGQYKDEPVRRP
ncbi:hypothetical protein EA462_12150 [Natrarchaeobius halalkaliphilus]|uniref:Uncharacterized protein n=1 Tax=Natrarchaeobius halalkaliphilus TaxID=1679091 RepID=A0A3N6LMR6_9EURY|nr:hypothetical protein EA462_12150 [Natrarchaeobius halalkaliphilus]